MAKKAKNCTKLLKKRPKITKNDRKRHFIQFIIFLLMAAHLPSDVKTEG